MSGRGNRRNNNNNGGANANNNVVQVAPIVMPSNVVTPLAPFEYNDNNRHSAAARWTEWKMDMDIFLAASRIVDDEQRYFIMLHQAGRDIKKICMTKWPDLNSYDQATERLDEYFTPRANVNFAIHELSQLRQGERGHNSETIADFSVRVQAAAEKCNFGGRVEMEVRRQLLIGTNNEILRKELLEAAANDSADAVVERARTKIAVQEQAKLVGQDGRTSVSTRGELAPVQSASHKYGPKSKERHTNDRRVEYRGEQYGQDGRLNDRGGDHFGGREGARGQTRPKFETNSDEICRKCGREWPHHGVCPALGKRCLECGELDHFARCCKTRKKHVSTVKTSNEDDDERSYLFSLIREVKECAPRIDATFNGLKVNVLIDLGAHEVVIDEATYARFRTKPFLNAPSTRLFPFGPRAGELKQLGEFIAIVSVNGRAREESVRVVSGNTGCLFGHAAARRFGLYQIDELFGDTGSNEIVERECKIDKSLVSVSSSVSKVIQVDHKMTQAAQIDHMKETNGSLSVESSKSTTRKRRRRQKTFFKPRWGSVMVNERTEDEMSERRQGKWTGDSRERGDKSGQRRSNTRKRKQDFFIIK